MPSTPLAIEASPASREMIDAGLEHGDLESAHGRSEPPTSTAPDCVHVTELTVASEANPSKVPNDEAPRNSDGADGDDDDGCSCANRR
jgi:hypothetical protein